MRLTKTHREAFVRAAMNDVPKIDYREKIQEVIQKHLENIAPPAIIKAYKDPKTKGYFRPDWMQTTRWNNDHFYLIPIGYAGHPPSVIEKINELKALLGKQEDEMNGLEKKLKGAIAAFSTRKAAAAAMPEFEKYLPEECEPTTKNLPALANLVADLIAAGWPKQKAEAEAKKRGKK